jgi:serine/threonine protein kinase/tetratricopeptide (TPR) repeat protein
MTCDEIDARLVEYVEGDLSADQAESFRAHIHECSTCRKAERDTRDILGGLSAARSLDASSSDAGPMPGTPTALADFEILEPVGRGGMGVVYRAWQRTLHRIVALKVLNAGVVQNERAVERFRREAQAAARLHHTNIVPIYAQGQADGQFYYAMELIEGRSLDQVVADEKKQQRASRGVKPVPVGTASLSGSGRYCDYRKIARQIAEVADGLQHAHEQDVVHRDIKPHNLLLGNDDRLHITDFGLARLLDEPGLTLSSDIVGTPVYMAPEQIARGGQPIDCRADVYSLGATLYEVLTLERPFTADSYESLLHDVLNREPARPRRVDARVPRDLETICVRAMEKDARQRFQTAGEMARDLRRYAEDFPIASRRIGPVGRLRRWARRNPARAAAGLLLVALAAIIPPAIWISALYAGRSEQAAWNTLIEDYHHGDAALKDLSWFTATFGDRRRQQFIRAYAAMQSDTPRAIRILEQMLRQADDPDVHCLLAWAYRSRATPDSSLWPRVEEHIAAAEANGRRPSADGFFFKGMALTSTDPIRAEEAFEQAINGRSNFTQAMLQQGRTITQIMYLTGGIGLYGKGVSRLDAVALLQQDNAYPKYYLANVHLLAGDVFRRDGQLAEAEEAYQASRKAALEAQTADPSSARGYVAEAFYYERQGKYDDAIAKWEQAAGHMDTEAEVLERCAYQMRLHFRLGQYEQAEALRKIRYSAQAGYRRAEGYDADEALFGALLAASAGDLVRARSVLVDAVAHTETISNAIVVIAGFALLGEPASPELSRDSLGAAPPPRWSVGYLADVQGLAGGALPLADVLSRADEQLAATPRESQRLVRPFLLAPASFLAGVHALARGDRDAAIGHFRDAAGYHDLESYCFRAMFILSRLEADPAWPAWLPENRSKTP